MQNISFFTLILIMACLFTNGCSDKKTVIIGGTYILQVPTLEMVTTDYQSKQAQSFRFYLVHDDGNYYLEFADTIEGYRLSSKFLNKDKTILPDNRFSVTMNGKSRLTIDGYIYESAGGLIQLKLTGQFSEDGYWKGTGIASLGGYMEILGEYQNLFSIHWHLYPEGMQPKNLPEIYEVKVTRETAPPVGKRITDEDILEINRKAEQRLKYGIPVTLNDFRSAKHNYSEDSRIQHFGNSSVANVRRRYACEKILPDIEWLEITLLPESLFLIDFLAVVEEHDVRNEIVQIYCCVDASFPPVIGADLETWTKVPLIFLLVHYTDWLTPERMKALANTTPRMRWLMAEIEKYGHNSPEHIDEIMESVLRQMPVRERFDYFAKCLRLRDYVKESGYENLRKLMPDNLPSPPGPSENIRTWTINNKPFVGTFVSVNKKEDHLILLDTDREAMDFFFSDISRADREYVRSILEKDKGESGDTEGGSVDNQPETK
jgi:hypothetical protein